MRTSSRIGSAKSASVLALVGLLGATLLAPAVSTAAPPATPPTIDGCPIFPANNVWNTRIDQLPVHPQSAQWIASIGASTGLKADFGAEEWEGVQSGIPFIVVGNDVPEVTVRFSDDEESDPGPYVVPADAPIEGGDDHHVLVLNRDTCTLMELFDATMVSPTEWTAGSGAIFDLRSHALRPETWTSADAAGLPILPGLVRYDEVAAGEINHALRFTVRRTQKAFVWPARHYAAENTSTSLPPMGARARLKSDLRAVAYPPEVRVILTALQQYGMFLADNGSDWFISGTPDSRWNDDNLAQLRRIVGNDLEFVDSSSLLVHPDSGEARIP